MTATFLPAQRATAIIGAVGTGKTEKLIEAIAATLDDGAQPSDILVLCSRQTAVDALRTRLENALGAAASRIAVSTPRERELAILDSDEAFAQTGRYAHLMNDFEINFFLEDMRVSGLKQRRLREMLKFFYRGWTELADDDPDWLITKEETNVSDFAKSRFAGMQAYHPAEVSAACLRYVRSHPEAAKSARIAHVFADDYRAFNRASQLLACELAGESITVCWDENTVLQGEDPYPYAKGLEEFEAGHSAVQTMPCTYSAQAEAPRCCLANVMAQTCFAGATAPLATEDAGQGAFRILESKRPENEFEELAAVVAQRMDEGCDPEELFVAAPNRAWGANAARALQNHGIAASVVEAKQAIGGDVRSSERSQSAQAFTALQLAADPTSSIAWRSWCGFGDYLTCSAGFSTLYDHAAERDCGLTDVLDDFDKGAITGITDQAKIAQRREQGQRLLKDVQGLCGTELISHLCAAVGLEAIPPALKSLLGKIADDETAETLYARAQKALACPTFRPDAVRVGCFDALAGQAPRTLIMTGLVNGFLPSRDYFDLAQVTVEQQAKMHDDLIRLLYNVAGKAHEELLCSYFTRTGLEDAERLRLKIERIQLDEGVRVCSIAPSIGLDVLQGR